MRGKRESVHEIDEHVWTSPLNASAIAGQIAEVIAAADPENAEIYEENCGRYQKELLDLDAEFPECGK